MGGTQDQSKIHAEGDIGRTSTSLDQWRVELIGGAVSSFALAGQLFFCDAGLHCSSVLALSRRTRSDAALPNSTAKGANRGSGGPRVKQSARIVDQHRDVLIFRD
jgi:hypothetical protein